MAIDSQKLITYGLHSCWWYLFARQKYPPFKNIKFPDIKPNKKFLFREILLLLKFPQHWNNNIDRIARWLAKAMTIYWQGSDGLIDKVSQATSGWWVRIPHGSLWCNIIIMFPKNLTLFIGAICLLVFK